MLGYMYGYAADPGESKRLKMNLKKSPPAVGFQALSGNPIGLLHPDQAAGGVSFTGGVS
jgi:hypothetical protein